MLAFDWTLQFSVETVASVESVVVDRESASLCFVHGIDFYSFFPLPLQATRLDLKWGS